MSLREYYGLVWERAWKLALNRTRKIAFLINIAVGFVLFVVKYIFGSPNIPWIVFTVDTTWFGTIVVFVGSCLWLMVQGSHELYTELLAKFPHTVPTHIRDRLRELIIAADEIIRYAEIGTVLGRADDVTRWLQRVETFVSGELGEPHLSRFRRIPNISSAAHRLRYQALKNVRRMLEDILNEPT